MSSETITKKPCNFGENLRPVRSNQTGGNLGETMTAGILFRMECLGQVPMYTLMRIKHHSIL